MEGRRLHIAVSGTYSTGKTTTAEALSILTGIAKTKAKTMREIVPDVFPGKMLEECGRKELSRLGLLRFRERLINESKISAPLYISDGSCLHEWVYGKGRLRFGISPKESYLYSRLRAIVGFRFIAKARDFLEIYGEAAKYHARKEYNVFIHLPVEFPMKNDGHRPISERFRKHTDELLIQTLNEIGMKYIIAGGTIRERLDKIINSLEIAQVMPIDKAIGQAVENVEKETLEIEELGRRQRQQYLESLKWWQRPFTKYIGD